EAWLRAISEADGVACISATVAAEYRAWFARTFGDRANPPETRHFPLGADIEQSAPSRGLPGNAQEILEILASRPTLLAVGTIEPRKRYDQVLRAFQRLWAGNIVMDLVIVGKQGWHVEALLRVLSADPEAGS